MIVVIIAGGSGTRLWPLSTHKKPKQVVNLIGDKSLVQNTYARAKNLSEKVYILTEISHAHEIIDQIPDLPKKNFIIEPARRGTAGCIIAALDQLSRICNKDEAILFMSADHQTRDVDGFVYSFKKAEKLTNETGKIVLVGVEPTYPATGFGYIEKGEVINSGYKVIGFKEKPDYATARDYVRSGKYSWNAGYFVGSYNTFKKEIEKVAPKLEILLSELQAIDDIASKEYKEKYLSFESDSIDYALIEKVKDLMMVPANFDWVDVGSYKDLHDVSDQDERGNSVQGVAHLHEVDNAYIRNEENKPIAIIGLDNVVVTNTPDGLIVARKDMSQKVGDISKKIQNKEDK